MTVEEFVYPTSRLDDVFARNDMLML